MVLKDCRSRALEGIMKSIPNTFKSTLCKINTKTAAFPFFSRIARLKLCKEAELCTRLIWSPGRKQPANTWMGDGRKTGCMKKRSRGRSGERMA